MSMIDNRYEIALHILGRDDLGNVSLEHESKKSDAFSLARSYLDHPREVDKDTEFVVHVYDLMGHKGNYNHWIFQKLNGQTTFTATRPVTVKMEIIK